MMRRLWELLRPPRPTPEAVEPLDTTPFERVLRLHELNQRRAEDHQRALEEEFERYRQQRGRRAD